jgi:hypothetical protein
MRTASDLPEAFVSFRRTLEKLAISIRAFVRDLQSF